MAADYSISVRSPEKFQETKFAWLTDSCIDTSHIAYNQNIKETKKEQCVAHDSLNGCNTGTGFNKTYSDS